MARHPDGWQGIKFFDLQTMQNLLETLLNSEIPVKQHHYNEVILSNRMRPITNQQNLTVKTHGGKKVLCDKMVENYLIYIKGRNLPINLSVFKSLGYDVILGMDWFSKYYASINCRVKVVVSQLPGVESFKFNGSSMRATRNIRQGASAFLAYLTAKLEAERKLEDIPVACDYPDVFAEVATGLSLPLT